MKMKKIIMKMKKILLNGKIMKIIIDIYIKIVYFIILVNKDTFGNNKINIRKINK
jgi:hypothetical protein